MPVICWTCKTVVDYETAPFGKRGVLVCERCKREEDGFGPDTEDMIDSGQPDEHIGCSVGDEDAPRDG
jgi:hypothetical protein